MHGDQNHNNSIKGSLELTLLRLLETSLKYVKPKVETKVEQSGTWLKALAEASAKMVPMVVQHRPTQSTTSPLPITNPTPAVVTTTRLPIQSPQTMIPCEEFEVLHWQQNMTHSFLAILFKAGNPNPNPRTISPDPNWFPLGT
jgi:hypothetical protein